MTKQVLRKGISVFLTILFTMIPFTGIMDVTVRWRSTWTKKIQVKKPNDNKSYRVSDPGTFIYIDGKIAYCLQLGAPATTKQGAQLLEYNQTEKATGKIKYQKTNKMGDYIRLPYRK